MPSPIPFHHTFAHKYLDDDPTNTPSDNYILDITIDDGDGGIASTTAQVTVNNVDPTVTITSITPVDSVSEDEGGVDGRLDETEGFVVKGTITDPGVLDTHTGTLEVDLNFDGDVADTGETVGVPLTLVSPGSYTFEKTIANVLDDGRWTDASGIPAWNNETKDDPVAVKVRVVDDDTGTGLESDEIDIYNIDPTLIVESVTEVPDVEPGKVKEVNVEGTIIEIGVKDLHKVTLIWGDGHQQTVITATRQFSFMRELTGDIAWVTEDLYPLVIKLVDDDLGPDEKTIPRVNLTIYHGVTPSAVPQKDEVRIGAVTVANLNDTDGDGTLDFEDSDGVIASATGEDEVDLMRLEIDRPVPYDGGPVALSVVPGTGLCPGCGASIVGLWADPTKTQPIGLGSSRSVVFSNWGENETKKTVYVEAMGPTSIRGISLEVEYKGQKDLVTATGVWATLTTSKSDTEDVKLPGAGADFMDAAPWSELTATDGVRQYVEIYGGTGVRPVAPAPVGVTNLILTHWTIFPVEVTSAPYTFVKVDGGRRNDTFVAFDGNPPKPPIVEHFPTKKDFANDDGHDEDETGPKASGSFFTVDGPGFNSDTPMNNDTAGVHWGNFEEFIRMDIGTRPTGPGTKGSRASAKFLWHARSSVTNVGNKWVRLPGEPNDVSPGHF
ncbi:MAG: hypothetical protein H8E66_31500 [Planctomycetes bacterium]|nr:hypothetical protein [Planctomycetota bacterium]